MTSSDLKSNRIPSLTRYSSSIWRWYFNWWFWYFLDQQVFPLTRTFSTSGRDPSPLFNLDTHKNASWIFLSINNEIGAGLKNDSKHFSLPSGPIYGPVCTSASITSDEYTSNYSNTPFTIASSRQVKRKLLCANAKVFLTKNEERFQSKKSDPRSNSNLVQIYPRVNHSPVLASIDLNLTLVSIWPKIENPFKVSIRETQVWTHLTCNWSKEGFAFSGKN